MTTDSPEPEPSDLDAIRTDIEQTRAELVDAVKQAAVDKASQAKAAAPAPVQSALNSIGDKAGPPAHRAGEAVSPYRNKIIAGVTAGLVVVLIVRRRRRES